MRTEGWQRDRWRDLLKQLRDRTGLGDKELAALSGRSRSQVNRWNRAENQPDYEGVRRLAEGLQDFGPEISALGIELLKAAGYSPPEPVVRVSQVEPETTPPPEPGARVRRYDERHLEATVAVDRQAIPEEVLGPLTQAELAMVTQLRALKYSPESVIGAVVLVRRIEELRADIRTDDEARKRA